MQYRVQISNLDEKGKEMFEAYRSILVSADDSWDMCTDDITFYSTPLFLLSLSLSLSVCVPLSLSLSVCLSVSLDFVSLSLSASLSLSLCFCFFLSLSLSPSLSVCLSVCLSHSGLLCRKNLVRLQVLILKSCSTMLLCSSSTFREYTKRCFLRLSHPRHSPRGDKNLQEPASKKSADHIFFFHPEQTIVHQY